MADQGGYVGILKEQRDVNLARLDMAQVTRLSEYLASLRDRALILAYDNDMDLAAQVDAILLNAVARDQGRVEGQATNSAPVGAEIWPKIESEDTMRSDSKGRIRTSKRYYIVLKNTGGSAARNIRLSFQAKNEDPSSSKDPWMIYRLLNEEPGAVLAEQIGPEGELRLPIEPALSSPLVANVEVSWEDERGDQQNTATLRVG